MAPSRCSGESASSVPRASTSITLRATETTVEVSPDTSMRAPDSMRTPAPASGVPGMPPKATSGSPLARIFTSPPVTVTREPPSSVTVRPARSMNESGWLWPSAARSLPAGSTSVMLPAPSISSPPRSSKNSPLTLLARAVLMSRRAAPAMPPLSPATRRMEPFSDTLDVARTTPFWLTDRPRIDTLPRSATMDPTLRTSPPVCTSTSRPRSSVSPDCAR